VTLTYLAHPLSCHDAYCGYNYIYKAVGCCGTYSGANSTYTLGGCNYQVACIDWYDVAGNCDQSCLTESMILKWWVFRPLCFSGANDMDYLSTSSAATWCNTYTFPEYGYTSLMCGTEYTMITVSLGTTTPGVTKVPSFVTTSYRPVSFSTLVPGAVTTMRQSYPISTTSSGIQSHLGEIAAGAVGGALGTALLLGIALYLCLRKRSGRPGATIGAAMADGYGQPLMGHASRGQTTQGYYG
jgi:hypothetical protein